MNVQAFAEELTSHPDRSFVSKLLTDLREGFQIGDTGPQFSGEAPNLKSAQEYPEVVSAYMHDEVRLGHIAGPYSEPPLPYFRVNPLGVVPKKTPGKWRSILHLSYPPGSSGNDYISKADYSLQYVTIDRVISHIKQLGQGCYLSKLDVEAAFRIAPVHPNDWHLLGMKWQGQYYFDMRLSMGSRSSPFNFDTIGKAIEFIVQANYAIAFIEHILDDFITIESGAQTPVALNILIRLFQKLGVQEKIFGPTTCLDFLGITLEARLPPDKVDKLVALISTFSSRRICTKRELLSLIGSFSFASKVIVPGCTFLSRMIRLSCSMSELHYHVCLNNAFREDLSMWELFLQDWNGCSFFF